MISRRAHLPGQFTGFPQVVAVEKGEKLTPGLANPRVARPRDALVPLPKIDDPFPKSAHARGSVVCGAIVHHDDLSIFKVLRERALQRRADIACLVIRRYDYADGRVHASPLPYDYGGTCRKRGPENGARAAASCHHGTAMNRASLKRLTLVLVTALVLMASAGPEDRWRGIGPGGGGALFHPTVSPHDPRTALVACDMTGNYMTTDAGGRWRSFNLGGPVQFFLFDPVDPRVIYAKAGALFRSSDGGTTWARFLPKTVAKITMGDDHASHTLHGASGPQGDVGAMAIDPADSRVLYVAIDSALWTSPDGGATWRKAADLPGRARRMWIDPRSSKAERTLYVAGPDAIYRREAGAWRTGASPGGFTDVSGNPPRFYATAVGRIFVSRDGGMTWSASFLPGFGGRATAIAAGHQQPDIAYVSYSDLRAPIRATRGVAKTVDGGRHWTSVWHTVRDAWLTEVFNAEWVSNPLGLGVAPGTPDVVYATDYGRTLRTFDGGASWQAVYSTRMPDGGWTTNGLDVTTSYGVHFDPFDPQHMFISYTDIGLFGSDNGGASWYSAARIGVPGSWVNTTYWMEFDPNVRGRMWAVMSGLHDLPRPKMWRGRSPETYDGGVVRSDDGGRTWRVQGTGMPQTAATHILRDPGGTLYVAGFGRGVFKSTDGGEHWALKNVGIDGAQPFAWRLARDTKGVLYLVVARRSDDGTF